MSFYTLAQVRESSLVWNYKYADVEFGRVQARDLLQHLWTGPISNAPVDIVQGARSVEARPVSVSKGASMARIMALMAERGIGQGFEYVLCMGHFLGRDENLFSFFEGKGLGPAAKDQHLAGPVTGATSSAEQRRTKHRWPTDPGLGPKSHLEEESGEPPVPPCSSSSLLVNMMRARALGKPSSASNPTAPSASHWIPEGYGEAKKDDGFDSIASHEVEVSPRDLGNETSSSGAPFAQSLTPGCLAMHTTGAVLPHLPLPYPALNPPYLVTGSASCHPLPCVTSRITTITLLPVLFWIPA